MGIKYSAPTVALADSLIKSGDANIVLHFGDICMRRRVIATIACISRHCIAAYADDRAGTNNGTFYEQVLDDFYNEIQPLASAVPYMMSPGNHVSRI